VDRKWVTLSNTTVGTFMALLDSSIVVISLPTIGRELPGATPGVLLWIVLSYSLVTTTLLLSLGRLSDMFGRVRLYTLGFAVFTVGSGLASLSGTGGELLAARVVQGVGAGFLFSNSAAILTDAFPAGERGRALGINQVAALSGSILGLVLGGVLTTELGWRSIFWVNLPVGAFGTWWAYAQLVELHRPEVGAKLDLWGNLTFGLGLTVTLVGLTLGSLGGWDQPLNVAFLVVGPALLVAFVWVERRAVQPMFDLGLFRIRTFVAGNAAAFLAALARGAFTFVMVFYFQGVLRASAEEAGLLLLPLSAAFAVAGPVSGIVSDFTGARSIGTAGLLLSCVGFGILVLAPAAPSYTMLAAAMVLLGIGQGMFAAPNRSEVMSSVPAPRRGIAAGVGTTFLSAGNLGSLIIGFTVLATVVPAGSLALAFAGQSAGAVDASAFASALHVLFSIALALTASAAAVNMLRGPHQTPPTSAEVGAPTPV
jgi:EmrB/QacA subfamily drug resistance transporter